jgi:3-(3-hydroxy-phenyl)propionate hydroxylase
MARPTARMLSGSFNEPDEHALSDEAIHGRIQRAFPKTGAYDLVHRNLYETHQRVALKFRVGRVFSPVMLPTLNNPIGGLGLNCGIHDAMKLADTLRQFIAGPADESLLARCERRRRPTNIEFARITRIYNPCNPRRYLRLRKSVARCKRGP